MWSHEKNLKLRRDCIIFYIACYCFGVWITWIGQNMTTHRWTHKFWLSHLVTVIFMYLVFFSCAGGWTDRSQLIKSMSKTSSLVGSAVVNPCSCCSAAGQAVNEGWGLKHIIRLTGLLIGPGTSYHQAPSEFVLSPCLDGFKLSRQDQQHIKWACS